MFDNVGKNIDQNAAGRSALSTVLSALALGGLVLGYAAWGLIGYLWPEPEPELFVADDTEMVEIVMEDEPLEDEAPPPPPPPPPPPADGADEEEEEEEEEDDTEPEPDEMVEEIKELDKEVKEEVKKVDKPKGQEGGIEGGVEGGVVGGVIGGVEGGVVGGTLGGSFVKMHRSELEIKKQISPNYPAAAKQMNLGDQRCKARVTINEKGEPIDVRVEDCPKVFHAVTIEAMLKWRWYPPKSGGQKVKAQTTIAITYKMR